MAHINKTFLRIWIFLYHQVDIHTPCPCKVVRILHTYKDYNSYNYLDLNFYNFQVYSLDEPCILPECSYNFNFHTNVHFQLFMGIAFTESICMINSLACMSQEHIYILLVIFYSITNDSWQVVAACQEEHACCHSFQPVRVEKEIFIFYFI